MMKRILLVCALIGCFAAKSHAQWYGGGFYSPAYERGQLQLQMMNDAMMQQWQMQQQQMQQQLQRQLEMIKNGGGSVPVSGYVPDVYIPPTPSTYDAPATSTPSSNQPSSTPRQCPYCNGKGRKVYNSHPAWYGTTDNKVYCSECGEYHLQSTGHSHVSCSHCHGTGQL